MWRLWTAALARAAAVRAAAEAVPGRRRFVRFRRAPAGSRCRSADPETPGGRPRWRRRRRRAGHTLGLGVRHSSRTRVRNIPSYVSRARQPRAAVSSREPPLRRAADLNALRGRQAAAATVPGPGPDSRAMWILEVDRYRVRNRRSSVVALSVPGSGGLGR